MTEPIPPSTFVVALVTTYRRSGLLTRLLTSLGEIRTPLAVLVVDNAGDPDTEAAIDSARAQDHLEITRLLPGANLGCGGALEYAEREALERYPQATHFWTLDDDAVVEPGALERLLTVMREKGAQLACPSILNDAGCISWFPGVTCRAVFKTLKTSQCTPEAYRARWGNLPQPLSWSVGIALLYTREALERHGFHRGDFWLRGEDIEYSLRLTHRNLGLFVPDAFVRHLPPPDPGGPESRRSERLKHWWMIRNSAYISLRLPHGHRILRSLPGNLWRYVKVNGPLGLWGAFTALVEGVRGNLGPLPPAPAGSLNAIVALADQDFAITKSLGILNVSTSLAETLAADPRVNRTTILGNATLRLALPPRPTRVLNFNQVIGSKLVRLLWSQWGVYSEAKAAPSDWLILPKGYAPLFKKPPCRLAAYVHDTMLFHYAERYPRRMPFFESLYLRMALRATIVYADIIFTNSEFTRGEVLKLARKLQISPPPIVTVGIGFNEPAQLPARKKNQILFLASKWPHKLTAQALEFADRWQRETAYDGEIVWVGSIPHGTARPGHPNWKFHSRLPEGPYREIFRESRAVVFFSEYEGFGMPPVEAAIARTAPVYSNIPAVSEGMQGMGFPFENGDYKSFAQALRNGLNSDGVVLEQWSRTLVNTHNWTKVAGKIIHSLEKIGSGTREKILVFAHIPPPHHGQSYMVKLMLDGFERGSRDLLGEDFPHLKCFHVNCRVSDGMEDIGIIRFGKIFLLFRYIVEALWKRARYGVRSFYYVPAPGKRAALYRDWLVMLFCRPFFARLVLHWHASGVCDWLEREGRPFERWITRKLLGRPELSIVLAKASSTDARWLESREIAVVPNGIPDPCPDFDERLRPLRAARIAERRTQGGTLRVLYMAHCTRDKGLFDALEGVAIFNQRAPGKLRAHLTIGGAFMDPAQEREFQERIARPDLEGSITYAGFVSGAVKKQLFETSDCVCFPTYYIAESFPITLVEAAAYGLPSVVTRWRAIPEIQPPDYPAFVDPQSPAQIADALECVATADFTDLLRQRFLAQFSEAGHLEQMARAFRMS